MRVRPGAINTSDVCQHDELFRTQCLSNSGGGSVGIDVENLSGGTTSRVNLGTHRCNDRNLTAIKHRDNEIDVDVNDVSHQTHVYLLAINNYPRLPGRQKARVLA